jgi:starch synthase
MLLPAGDRMELMRIFTTRLGDTPVYLLDIPAAFDREAVFDERDYDRRFILFARGILALMLHLQECEGRRPAVLHANDWHTGLLPNYLKLGYAHLFGPVATIYTIHNDANGWPILRARGMREDHSWNAAAREYVALYEWATREV